MQRTLNEVAKELAALYNNVDMYKIDSSGSPELVKNYQLAIDLLESRIDGICFLLRLMGYVIQIEGHQMGHTVIIRQNAVHTSRCNLVRKPVKKAC